MGVVGDAKIESTPRPTTARPTQPPTQPPTRPPTQPPTRPATRPPTRPPTEAPAAAVQYVAVHAVPVQYVQVAQAAPVQTVSASYGGFYHSGFAGACGGDGQEVFGADGARYVLKKIA